LMDHSIQSFTGGPYQSSLDTFRLCLELLLLLLLLVTMAYEFVEMHEIGVSEGSCWNYFGFWNTIDWIWYLCLLSCAAIWVFGVYREIDDFNPHFRYHYYDDMVNFRANILFYNVNQAAAQSVYDIFSKAISIGDWIEIYTCMNAVCMSLILLRIVKLFKFQPHLGIISKTITKAMNDLVHFLLVFLIIFSVYMLFAYWVFGSTVNDFSQIGNAFNSCWNMLMGDTKASNAIMHEVHDKSAAVMIPAWIFVYSYVFFVFLLLLNILLAIIVEAYDEVKKESTKQDGILGDVSIMWKAFVRSTSWGREAYAKQEGNEWARNFLNDRELLHLLHNVPESPDVSVDRYLTTEMAAMVDKPPRPSFTVQLEPDENGLQNTLEASQETLMRALDLHPETRDMLGESVTGEATKMDIACTTLLRYGKDDYKDESISAEEISNFYDVDSLEDDPNTAQRAAAILQDMNVGRSCIGSVCVNTQD